MLDLAYVLLVTFIILTTVTVAGVRVHLPRTQRTANLPKPPVRAITVTLEGTTYLDGYPVNIDQLRGTLARYRAADPALAVVLRADSAARYRTVKEVLALVKGLDITDIGLVTTPAGPAGR